MNPDSIYWITETLQVWPAVLWMYLGVGIPWALAVLPREDWYSKVQVAALGFALGPALVTAWMLLLSLIGTTQNTALLRFDLIFAGTVVIAASGVFLAYRRLRTTQPAEKHRTPLLFDEKLLIVLIIAALVLRWLTTSFWPFTAYDPLWVFGYEGRLYTLMHTIPNDIGYYPQFVPLQYTYAQLAVGGISDHAARAVLPLMQLGSIFAAYVLGARLLTRRIGIIAAAIWALYPHVGDWAHVGDLEIPLTFMFTLSAAFFLLAWTSERTRQRRHYAVLAGVVFGIAMWTKPTAGAFVWGVVLLVTADFVRVRGRIPRWWPRFEVAALTGLACIPLGAVWYVRNALLGYNPIELPDTFWLTQARRSGDLFGWFLLALLAGTIYVMLNRRKRSTIAGLIISISLIFIGLLPGMPLVNPARINPPESFITPTEWLAVIAGIAILIWTAFDYVRAVWGGKLPAAVQKIGWAFLLALPYFVTFFYSYSYHYRLVFAIVPLLILPTAVILAHLLPPDRVTRLVLPARGLYMLLIVFIALPGIASTLFDTLGKTGWLWDDTYPDDTSKYVSQNPGVMMTVFGLREYMVEHDIEPVVVVPGDERLQFFFPELKIRNDALPNKEHPLPTRLDELEGATHFVYSTQGRWLYEAAGIAPEDNQIVSALGRTDIMTLKQRHTTGTFRYELYELALENRFVSDADSSVHYQPPETYTFGDSLRYVGDSIVINNLTFAPGNATFFDLQWEVLAPLDADYEIQYDLVNMDDDTTVLTWKGHVGEGEHGYYSTVLWQPGEKVMHSSRFLLPDGLVAPNGNNYRVIVRFYDPATDTYLPVSRDGESIGDGMPLAPTFSVWLGRRN